MRRRPTAALADVLEVEDDDPALDIVRWQLGLSWTGALERYVELGLLIASTLLLLPFPDLLDNEWWEHSSFSLHADLIRGASVTMFHKLRAYIAL